MAIFKMPKKATEPKKTYEGVINYIISLATNNPDSLRKITKKEAKKLNTAIKNLRKLVALAEKQGKVDPYKEVKPISLISGFDWEDNCANGGNYWVEIYNILKKIEDS